MTVEEMNAKYGAPPTASGGGTLANRWQKETSPSLGSSIAETAKGGFQNLKSGFSDVFSPPQIDSGAVKEAARGGGLGAGALELGAQALQGGEHAVAGVGKIVGGAAQIATSPVLGPATAVGSAIGKKIGNAVPADVAMRFEDALRAHPEIGKNATEIMNLLNLAVPETAEKISPAISSGIEKGKSMITPEDTLAAKTAQIESKKAATAAKVKSIAQEWEKPTIPAKTTNPASFNKARDVLAKEPETPQFLAEQGLHPADMVENGRFATEDTATALRDTAAKMSHDTIRPSLQMADYSTPRTPVPDLVKLAIQKVTEDKSLTEGERTNVIRNINKEGIALQKKYPNGMKLEDMHDNKITYASKGGYRPDKTALDNNLATANRHFGSAMQEMVEKKAPEDVPVAEFNKYLGKYYKAADYLDALDTKKAPVSLGRSFSRAALKFGGAALAEHFGGGVVSAFAGYSIGKAIEHALENMPNPVRAEFLRNLEKTNPEAFTKVQEYLKAQTSGNTGIPRLPEPTSIQLPPPSEETQMTGRARELFPKSEGGGPETPSAPKADTSGPFDGGVPKELGGLAKQAKGVSYETFKRRLASNIGSVDRGEKIPDDTAQAIFYRLQDTAQRGQFDNEAELFKDMGGRNPRRLPAGEPITTYRASPTADLRPGDFVSTDKGETGFYLSSTKKVYTHTINPEDLVAVDGSMGGGQELIYLPKGHQPTTPVQFFKSPRDFYDTVNGSSPSIPKELEPLAAEARKYKSAEEFVRAIKEGPDGAYIETTLPTRSLGYGEPTEASRRVTQAGRRVTEPIDVTYDPTTRKFNVEDGQHRLTQAKINGDKEIPVRLKISSERLDANGDVSGITDYLRNNPADFYNKVKGKPKKQ